LQITTYSFSGIKKNKIKEGEEIKHTKSKNNKNHKNNSFCL
jgi:hypothetical protein